MTADQRRPSRPPNRVVLLREIIHALMESAKPSERVTDSVAALQEAWPDLYEKLFGPTENGPSTPEPSS